MSFLNYEGVIDHDHIQLNDDVRLPDNTRVHIPVPDVVSQQAMQEYEVCLPQRGPDGTPTVAYIYSPHVASPGRSSDLRLEIVEENADAEPVGFRPFGLCAGELVMPHDFDQPLELVLGQSTDGEN